MEGTVGEHGVRGYTLAVAVAECVHGSNPCRPTCFPPATHSTYVRVVYKYLWGNTEYSRYDGLLSSLPYSDYTESKYNGDLSSFSRTEGESNYCEVVGIKNKKNSVSLQPYFRHLISIPFHFRCRSLDHRAIQTSVAHLDDVVPSVYVKRSHDTESQVH